MPDKPAPPVFVLRGPAGDVQYVSDREYVKALQARGYVLTK